MTQDLPLRITVLMGGKSNEHDISLRSGENMVRFLDRKKYRVRPIIISKQDEWFVSADFLQEEDFCQEQFLKQNASSVKKMTVGEAMDHVLCRETDLVLLALHGAYGEDGTIQGMLDYLGIPYNGSGVMASALAMDKVMAKTLFLKAGLATPDYQTIREVEWRENRDRIRLMRLRTLGFPVY